MTGRGRGSWVVAGVALALTAAVSAAALAVGGYDPLAASHALVAGSVGGPAALTTTLLRAVPLALTGLAVALAFRAGVWNIGAEGQLYAGATAGVWFALVAGPHLGPALAIPGTLLFSAGAGTVWAGFPAWLRRHRGVGEVITTILMNFVALHAVAYLVSGPLRESRRVFQQTDPIPDAARLPHLIPGTRLHTGLLLAVGAGLLLWAVIRFTRWGFEVRAVGHAPGAAAVAGAIDAGRRSTEAFLVSGALAGLAGGVQVAGVTYALYPDLSPGWGYTAIAVALLAGLNPLGVLGAAAFFGALEAGGGAMQRDAGIPAVWVSAVVATVILAVLAAERIRSGDDA